MLRSQIQAKLQWRGLLSKHKVDSSQRTLECNFSYPTCVYSHTHKHTRIRAHTHTRQHKNTWWFQESTSQNGKQNLWCFLQYDSFLVSLFLFPPMPLVIILMCYFCVCLGTQGQKGALNLLDWSYKWLRAACGGCWEPNSSLWKNSKHS